MLGMNAHALGVRHDLIIGDGHSFMCDMQKGINDYLSATESPRKVPVVNLQCDVDHPTQALADLLFLGEKLGDIRGKKIAVSWAYSPSYAKPLSVPQGLITLLTRYGAHISLAHPSGYRLMDRCLDSAKAHAAESGGSFTVTDSMDEAFEDAVAVYPKSWGPFDLMTERVEKNRANDKAGLADIERRALARNANHKDWICDERRMALTRGGDALYMHCLPADIGAEVTPGVMAKHTVNVAREANWKVYVIMAMLAVAKVENLPVRLAAL
jgi:ornithine carbamoyltransferase